MGRLAASSGAPASSAPPAGLPRIARDFSRATRPRTTVTDAIWRALTLEWEPEGLTCVLLRPGFVATEMTGGQGLAVEESVAGMKRVVEGLTPADAGRIVGYDGLDVPW